MEFIHGSITADAVHVDFDGWVFTVTISRERGLTSVGVRCEEGLSWRRVRTAPIGEIEAAVRAGAPDRLAEAIGEPVGSADVRALGREFADRPRPGAAGRRDSFYVELAREYVTHFENNGDNAARALAKAMHLSVVQVRSLLGEARRRGFLTSAPPGRAGGQLTARGIEMLREIDNGKR